MNVTDPDIIKYLFDTDKKHPNRNNGMIRHTEHKNSTKASFKNSIRQLTKDADEKSNEKRLNQTDVIQSAMDTEKKEQHAKMNVIESISNFAFEGVQANSESKKTPLYDRMRDDIKPMFFFNAKNRKKGDKESDSGQIQTPCFEELLSKNNSQIEINMSKASNNSNSIKFKKKEQTKDVISVHIPNLTRKKILFVQKM